MGVFVGITGSDYEVLAHHHRLPVGPLSFTAASTSVASGRIAFTFGLHGPSASVDTACSSSLVATHMAMSHLRREQGISAALPGAVVAGVLVACVPQSLAVVALGGMASADGRCKTLDVSADGYVRAEACHALWLMPRATVTTVTQQSHSTGANGSEPHAPAVLAYIAGTAVNTNGRASSLTAPHGPSQRALLSDALSSAGMHPHQVVGLQMHANGG
jgi:acyl transferase domain-containing protein